MKLKLHFIIAAFIALVIYIPAAHGQARLTFSGGSGAPLSTTLQTNVAYTIINNNCTAGGPVFLFDETGNSFLGSFLPVTGTITFSINNGAAQPIDSEATGVAANDITPNDTFIYGNQTGLANGSTVVLNAGTITTDNNVGGARPANGNYTTFITDGNGVRCSTNGASLAPTAAFVSISGRVITPQVLGLTNVLVTLTDMQGNSRTVLTGKFGSFRFTDVVAGETYILSVISKRHTYTPQVITVTEDIVGLSFIAQ